jgi:hypothetical protein
MCLRAVRWVKLFANGEVERHTMEDPVIFFSCLIHRVRDFECLVLIKVHLVSRHGIHRSQFSYNPTQLNSSENLIEYPRFCSTYMDPLILLVCHRIQSTNTSPFQIKNSAFSISPLTLKICR